MFEVLTCVDEYIFLQLMNMKVNKTPLKLNGIANRRMNQRNMTAKLLFSDVDVLLTVSLLAKPRQLNHGHKTPVYLRD